MTASEVDEKIPPPEDPTYVWSIRPTAFQQCKFTGAVIGPDAYGDDHYHPYKRDHWPFYAGYVRDKLADLPPELAAEIRALLAELPSETDVLVHVTSSVAWVGGEPLALKSGGPWQRHDDGFEDFRKEYCAGNTQGSSANPAASECGDAAAETTPPPVDPTYEWAGAATNIAQSVDGEIGSSYRMGGISADGPRRAPDDAAKHPYGYVRDKLAGLPPELAAEIRALLADVRGECDLGCDVTRNNLMLGGFVVAWTCATTGWHRRPAAIDAFREEYCTGITQEPAAKPSVAKSRCWGCGHGCGDMADEICGRCMQDNPPGGGGHGRDDTPATRAGCELCSRGRRAGSRLCDRCESGAHADAALDTRTHLERMCGGGAIDVYQEHSDWLAEERPASARWASYSRGPDDPTVAVEPCQAWHMEDNTAPTITVGIDTGWDDLADADSDGYFGVER